MFPCNCRIKHDPENGQYGDCLRASIASVFNYTDPEDVPHFYHDGCDGETGNKRLREWLSKEHNCVPFLVYFDGGQSRDEVLNHINETNPDIYYLLFGASDKADHVVICRNNKIIHNTAWVGSHIIGPNSNGYWCVMVFVHKITAVI